MNICFLPPVEKRSHMITRHWLLLLLLGNDSPLHLSLKDYPQRYSLVHMYGYIQNYVKSLREDNPPNLSTNISLDQNLRLLPQQKQQPAFTKIQHFFNRLNPHRKDYSPEIGRFLENLATSPVIALKSAKEPHFFEFPL